MADPFTILIQNLNELGFYDFVLPFLFVFAIVYGLLAKLGLFGGANNRVSALIGLVAAFFAVGYYGPPMAAFFTSLFGGATIVLAGILIVVLFAAMTGVPLSGLMGVHEKKGLAIALLVLVVLGVIVFMTATGTIVTGVELNEQAIAAIFIVIVIVIAMLFVVGEKKEAAAPPPAERAPQR